MIFESVYMMGKSSSPVEQEEKKGYKDKQNVKD
jgi:hypothetical protein